MGKTFEQVIIKHGFYIKNMIEKRNKNKYQKVFIYQNKNNSQLIFLSKDISLEDYISMEDLSCELYRPFQDKFTAINPNILDFMLSLIYENNI
jgi:hypothetical protein